MKRRSPPNKSDRAGADPRFVEDWLGHAAIVTRPGEESLQSLYGAAALLSRQKGHRNLTRFEQLAIEDFLKPRRQGSVKGSANF